MRRKPYHLHHVIKAVEDIFTSLLGLDSHLSLMFRWRLKTCEISKATIKDSMSQLESHTCTYLEPPERIARVWAFVEKATGLGARAQQVLSWKALGLGDVANLQQQRQNQITD